MNKGDIVIKNAIVHILDSSIGLPVLSDVELDYGSDLADFLKEHIFKTLASDDIKKCSFMEDESEIYNMMNEIKLGDTDFILISKKIAENLYQIMNSNIEIPAADLFVVQFEVNTIRNIALLKMNFKESYTHTTMSDEQGNVNSIMKYRSILPTQTQGLSEAAIVNLDDFTVKVIEKKYNVNGAKENYFSKIFLKCSTKLSQKAKLSIVEKAVESVQKEYFNESEQFEEKMKAKSVIHSELTQQGSVSIPEIAAKIFEDKVELKEKFKEKIEKYKIPEEELIEPRNEATTKKFGKQNLVTDTGIEIKIPMEQYNSTDNIEFITNEDGTISVLIKNIGHITSK